jgi:hypothetical protein
MREEKRPGKAFYVFLDVMPVRANMAPTHAVPHVVVYAENGLEALEIGREAFSKSPPMSPASRFNAPSQPPPDGLASALEAWIVSELARAEAESTTAEWVGRVAELERLSAWLVARK